MKALAHTVPEIIFYFREHMSSPYSENMSFQIFLLVGHVTNCTGHNLLTDHTLKKITQDVLVRCSVIVSDHNVKLAGHFQNLVAKCYFQHCHITIIDNLYLHSQDKKRKLPDTVVQINDLNINLINLKSCSVDFEHKCSLKLATLRTVQRRQTRSLVFI